jgi:hypothetical protein
MRAERLAVRGRDLPGALAPTARRKIKAIDHRQAKTARRHSMQRIGINPNVEKVEMTGETNAHRAFLGEGRDR